MQRFQFRLASVLGWRALELEREESKLEALFAERNRREAELASLGEQEREAERVLSLDSVDGQALSALDAHRAGLHRAAGRLRAARTECDQRIAAQRIRVAEGERKVKLLERLKERRLAEWQIRTDRELEALASETSLAKWVRER
jgi:flagellar export protein FliJ